MEILDIPIIPLSSRELLNVIEEYATQGKKKIIDYANINTLNLAYNDKFLRSFLRDSDTVFVDGYGVLLAGSLLGYKYEKKMRATCPDFLEKMVKRISDKDLKIYFLAGKPGVAKQAEKKLKNKFKDAKIKSNHGYFKKEGQENEDVIKDINSFNPHILFIGFGMPLQEKWVNDNINRIDTNLFLLMGACLDFYTNSVKRGPKFLTDNGFEWLSRLFIEPKRLWKRYLIGNPLFFYRVLKEKVTST